MLNMGVLYMPLIFRTENQTEHNSMEGVKDMKKKRSRILSLILAAVMLFSVVPLSVLALAAEQETGRVATVLYGAEFTQIFVDKEGNLETLKNYAQQGIGEGIESFTVPKNAKIKLTKLDENGNETSEVYYMHQADRDVMNSMKFESEAIDALVSGWEAFKDDLGAIGDVLNLLGDKKKETEDKIQNYLAEFKGLSELSGQIYQTYVSDDIPTGDYRVYVEDFEKEGYVLRDYDQRAQVITVEPQDGNKVQYFGQEEKVGASLGTLDFSSFVDKIPGARLKEKVYQILDKYGWRDPIDLGFYFVFPGYWTSKVDIGFDFTNVDVSDQGIAGSEFVMINRDELVDILKVMIDLGKDTFEAVLANAFDTTEGTETYEGLISLHKNLINLDEEGQVKINAEKAYAILKTYIGILSDLDIYERIEPLVLPAILETTSGPDGKVTFNENSNVTLSWTLDILLQLKDVAKQLAGASYDVAKEALLSMVELPEAMVSFMDNAMTLVPADFADDMLAGLTKLAKNVLNEGVYYFAQRFGLVGKKMPTGYYLMFQKSAPEEYRRSLFAYTMQVEWKTETWVYATIADLGIIGPYFAEEFYTFVRNTTFEGTIDKFLGGILNKDDFDLFTKILNGETDITDKAYQTVLGAFNAFIGQEAFSGLGLDTIFASRTDLISGMTQYLLDNGRTTQNLMVYLNKQVKKAKSVYTSNVDENWYFYNLDKSLTVTATKLINKSTTEIAKLIAGDTKVAEAKKGIVTQTGSTVSSIVSKVGGAIENRIASVNEKIATSIKSAAKSVFSKAISSIGSVLSNLFSSMFNRGMITYNA